MAKYTLDYTGEEINNALATVLSGTSTGGGLGIEVVTLERNKNGVSTQTLSHPAVLVIANNGRETSYDELEAMLLTEYNPTVFILPGKSAIVCANNSNDRDDKVSLSADGLTLTLSAKGWTCTCVCFYQL